MFHSSPNKRFRRRRILITGAGGQLGLALQELLSENVQLCALDRKALDITDAQRVHQVVAEFKPDWIINAAGYTAVDKAETEVEKAFAVNRDGAENLARAASSVAARMVHISTDYVFDGRQTRPYLPNDATHPINIYGDSKLAGEKATREILADNLLIVRTAWVYSQNGKNFLTTMLKLMRELEEVKVVDDQIGSPTSVYSLAAAILMAIDYDMTGLYHWTDAGVASRYDFAIAIKELAELAGLIDGQCRILPIPSTIYQAHAMRPGYCILDKAPFRQALSMSGQQWRIELHDVIARLSVSG